jgi:hypothetical protein
MHRRAITRCALAISLVGLIPQVRAYSVLSHQAIIDVAWKDDLRPLLLSRFPAASPEDLLAARAYAYGGAIIQDLGYYPFGDKFFSDLLHYVRSGDFILNLLGEAQDLNEYAFALGAMAHYSADNHGHPVAVNRAVPMMFPKLERQFGPLVTYEDNPSAHLKVEFSFDVIQVAQGHYAPDSYHDFIGFQVAKPVLERAFAKTYSLSLSSLFLSEDLAIGTYRYTVSTLLPSMTKAAWNLEQDAIKKGQPGAIKKKFIYNLSRSDYRKQWGGTYQRPGIGARFIGFLFHLIPKIGPFKVLSVPPVPTPAETLFMKSFNETIDQYRALLVASGKGTMQLPNTNFDTGDPVRPGVYGLVDNTYAKLLDKVKGNSVSPELRADIMAFYSNLEAPFTTKNDAKAWQKVTADLTEFKTEKVPAPDTVR